MNTRFQRITPFMWFNDQAEQAVNFYMSVFSNSKITASTRYNKQSAQASGQKENAVMTIGFELDGQRFAAINGGPHFTFNEAVSLVVNCESQEEIDYYWSKLSEGGNEKAQQCGWLKDKFGVSWQVVPTMLPELLSNPDPTKSGNAMSALLKMKKIDIATLKNAAK
jgi:predicted 3-demethylubiquinone-9 3-methyltransferase (glyoxalase superfamily)